MKVLVCFGTRPEAIKMAPICFELKKRNIPYKLCVTAQHREMLDQVLSFFNLIPDYDLNLMKPNQNLNTLCSKILLKMDYIFDKDNFDIVLVHGDTSTSTMVALSSFHRGIKVGHIEAGLRTYNKRSPFPEELNRQITGRLSDIHFAPTREAKNNLINEGVDKFNIIVTGNTVIDALLHTLEELENGYKNENITNLNELVNFNKKVITVTGHRRENLGEGLENICDGIIELSENNDIEIVYPVHLNPNVQEIVFKKLVGKSNIHLINPLDYPSFIWLMNKSTMIISDSGGIQEEAPTLNVPVLVTRETTEREEGVILGFSYLVGTDKFKLVSKAEDILNSKETFLEKNNPFGNGKSSVEIVNFIMKN